MNEPSLERQVQILAEMELKERPARRLRFGLTCVAWILQSLAALVFLSWFVILMCSYPKSSPILGTRMYPATWTPCLFTGSPPPVPMPAMRPTATPMEALYWLRLLYGVLTSWQLYLGVVGSSLYLLIQNDARCLMAYPGFLSLGAFLVLMMLGDYPPIQWWLVVA